MESDLKHIGLAVVLIALLGGVGLYLYRADLGSHPDAREEGTVVMSSPKTDSLPGNASPESDELSRAIKEGQERALKLRAQNEGPSKNPVESFEELPLPDGVNDHKGSKFMAGFITEARLFSHKQDQIYRERPAYEENAEQMKESILALLENPISKDEVSKLLALARHHMEEYWAQDGLSGPQAYLECYMAQAAAELAVQADANNPAVYEDLAEIIQAAHPLHSVSVSAEEKPTNNIRVVQQLIGIREKQLALYEKAEVAWPPRKRGVPPVLKCFMELVNLYVLDGNPQDAGATYTKAAAWAERGGWTDMEEELRSHAETVQSTPERPMPVSLVRLALNARCSREELASARQGVTPESAFQFGRHWIRQTMFFEGPKYLEDQ